MHCSTCIADSYCQMPDVAVVCRRCHGNRHLQRVLRAVVAAADRMHAKIALRVLLMEVSVSPNCNADDADADAKYMQILQFHLLHRNFGS